MCLACLLELGVSRSNLVENKCPCYIVDYYRCERNQVVEWHCVPTILRLWHKLKINELIEKKNKYRSKISLPNDKKSKTKETTLKGEAKENNEEEQLSLEDKKSWP